MHTIIENVRLWFNEWERFHNIGFHKPSIHWGGKVADNKAISETSKLPTKENTSLIISSSGLSVGVIGLLLQLKAMEFIDFRIINIFWGLIIFGSAVVFFLSLRQKAIRWNSTLKNYQATLKTQGELFAYEIKGISENYSKDLKDTKEEFQKTIDTTRKEHDRKSEEYAKESERLSQEYTKLLDERIESLTKNFNDTFVATHNTLKRKARVAEVANDIHLAIHHIRNSIAELRANGKSTEESVLASLDSLHAWHRVMKHITGNDVRVIIKHVYVKNNKNATLTIKDISPKDPNLLVDTFLRVPREQKNGKTVKLSDNTDMKEVISSDEFVYYLNNDIKDDLKNGTFKSSWIGSNISKRPFSSTLVWPIRLIDKNVATLHGFLIVDSKNVNIFNPSVDVSLGFMYADALYILLDALKAYDKLAAPAAPKDGQKNG